MPPRVSASLALQRDPLRKMVRQQWWEARDLNARVAALTRDVEAVQTESEEMYKLYEQMQASTSWRITRPLRQVANIRGPKARDSRPLTPR